MKIYDDYLEDINLMYDEIIEELKEMDEDEVSDFGAVLYTEFFGDEYDGEYEEVVSNISDYHFTYEEVLELINKMGLDSFDIVLDLLQDEDDYDTNEGVSKKMKISNYNKKKKKYQKKSAAEIKRGKRMAKIAYKKNKINIKKYRTKNKAKTKAYQKSRREAIKKGVHKVKLRRKS